MLRAACSLSIALVALMSCGASHDEHAAVAPVTITVESASAVDAGPRDAAPDVVASSVDWTSVAAGWRGPQDATGLIGPAGAAVTGTPETIVLVHSAAIRADPRRDALRHILLGTLPGWSTFMPYDVVDPIVDVDWVMMAGSLVLGTTASNVYIAHYNLSEAQADVAMEALVKTLPRAVATNAFGHGAFSAFIDGADRLYVRPRPGVLAIVPLADGKRIAALLADAEVPADVRPGEIVRVVDNGAQRLATHVTPQIRRARYWLTATHGDATTLRVEGDCDSDDDARMAAIAVTLRVRAADGSLGVRLLAPWLSRVESSSVGNQVRAWVDLYEDDVQKLADIVASRTGAASP